MACAYHVDAEHELILIRPTGRFEGGDFVDLCRAVYEDDRRDPGFAHVWDTRAVDELVMDADVIPKYREFLAEYEAQATEGKVPILATRAVTRTFASMIVQVSKERPATFRLFDDVDAVAEWVGVPASALTHVSDGEWVELS